MNVLII